MKLKLLVVDDEPDFLHVLKSYFSFENYEVHTAGSGEEALALLEDTTFDAVVSDMAMDGMNGLDLLKNIKQVNANLPMIIMTGVGTIESAVEAIQYGAFHYVTKPFNPQDLENLVKRACENARLQRRLAEGYCQDDPRDAMVVGNSRAMQDIMQTVQKVAASNAPILITGETGTGKSLLAKHIHQSSGRAGKEFLTIDCAALADNLLESELFGHVKGAFTGAVSAKRGLLEEANGGTLFLDEIGEVPPPVQVKLLRAVQEFEIKPVGGNKSIKIDVRIISATSRDLKSEIEAGQFREDLYFRLAVIPLHMPPLRKRNQDILLFVNHFVQAFNKRYKKHVSRIDPAVAHFLLSAPWRGNIRELENAIERAVLLADSDAITPDNLCLSTDPGQMGTQEIGTLSLKRVVEEAEKMAIMQVLQEVGGNRTAAAKQLGIGRRTLYDKLTAYGLE
jgi:DNA-binding NtrC family response regulator